MEKYNHKWNPRRQEEELKREGERYWERKVNFFRIPTLTVLYLSFPNYQCNSFAYLGFWWSLVLWQRDCCRVYDWKSNGNGKKLHLVAMSTEFMLTVFLNVSISLSFSLWMLLFIFSLCSAIIIIIISFSPIKCVDFGPLVGHIVFETAAFIPNGIVSIQRLCNKSNPCLSSVCHPIDNK